MGRKAEKPVVMPAETKEEMPVVKTAVTPAATMEVTLVPGLPLQPPAPALLPRW